MSEKIQKAAVVLLNMGGPDSLAAVEPFLYNLFRDRDLIRVPIAQPLFAKLISRLRAPKVRARYAKIGGNSPINFWTERQRILLEESLGRNTPGVKVFTAMRYWNPLISETVAMVAKGEFEKIILLPLYPQYSRTTTGSSFREWARCYPGDPRKVVQIDSFCDHPEFVAAVNGRIDEALERFPEGVREEVQLIFSAHGLPERRVREGDPYAAEIQKTVAAVMSGRNFSHDHVLCFQSRVGPMKWLSPSTEETIRSLARQGKRHLLLIPVSFVSDHIETLYELNEEYRHVAEQAGILNYQVTAGLNDSPVFIRALSSMVQSIL